MLSDTRIEMMFVSEGDALHSLCAPNSDISFSGDLGNLTPCFVDIVILSGVHGISILLFLVHVFGRQRSFNFKKFLLLKRDAIALTIQLAVASILSAIPFLELNGKLGAADHLAPHEIVSISLSIISWSLLCVQLALERSGSYVTEGRWTSRFAVHFMASAEVVKLRMLVMSQPESSSLTYFDVLYYIYVALQALLSIVNLCWFPAKGNMQLEEDQVYTVYTEISSESERSSPEASSGIFGRILFTWLTPILSAGYSSKPICPETIPPLPPWNTVESVSIQFDKLWEGELKSTSPSLSNACWIALRPSFLLALPCKLLCDASQFAGPLLLGQLLKIISDKSLPEWQGYAAATAMFVCSFLGSVADATHFHIVTSAGQRLNATLGAKVHSKILTLAPSARSQFSSGRIFSLVSSDAEALNSLVMNALGLISSPLRIIVALYLLWSLLGPASLMAVLCLIFSMPINVKLMGWAGQLLKQALAQSDDRTKLETEFVGGIEVVKCSGWEAPFVSRILGSREKELRLLWRVSKLQAVILFVLFSIPTVIPVVSFGAFLLLGNDLTSATAFTALTLFNILRFPLFMLPSLLQQTTSARVSLDRLQEFLTAPSIDKARENNSSSSTLAISICGDFSWDGKMLALADVDLEIPKGSLVVVIGSTGSGKSTLINAMLGELQQLYGPPVTIQGSSAFVPQAAFISASSVRDNITFGLPFEATHYDRCVNAACLDTDLRQLAGGDQTELGDRGINLSGGQRQRVSIARALYSKADVSFLDDPLSALDSRVGKLVFERAVLGECKSKGKTVVLATNALYFVRKADLVLYMDGGKVVEKGPYDELMASGGAFASMMKEVQLDEEEDLGDDPTKVAAQSSATLATAGSGAIGSSQAPGAKLTSDETSAQGSISSEALLSFVSAMGVGFWLGLLIFSYLFVELLRVAATIWLSIWTSQSDSSSPSTDLGLSPIFYLGIYSAISAFQLISQLLNALENSRLGLKAADKLHVDLLNSLVKAPMSFFHTTPLGRIVNRLTRDTSEIDRQLASNIAMAFRSYLQIGSTVAMVSLIAPLALPPLIVILLCFWLLFGYYQATMRQVKRIESISRSPVLTSLTEAIAGTVTIRSFGAGPRLMSKHCDLVNGSSACTYINNALNRWLSVRLETLGALTVAVAGIVAVEGRGSPSSAGLIISYAMTMSVLFSIALRQSSVVENSLNSVERVVEYTHLPVEGAGISETDPDSKEPPPTLAVLPSGWPVRGDIQFERVAMRYRPSLPLVLRSVSFKALDGEKVGIVGRTGAGKSSLIGCIFRLAEIEKERGSQILLDGVDISRIPLSKLRSSMSLIPQVPVLFQGTIRLNLSPFGFHSDAELWNALRRSNLAPAVESWGSGLDTVLAEGGSPLSAGQKQLLALARALLSQSKLLVLDEATANVDVETDALIQRTMRSEFGHKTILAIAHRLHTVIDYNKILVLDKGLVAEFAPPAQLLSQPNSIFSSMVDDTGEATSKFLRSVASGSVDLSDALADAAKDGLDKVKRLDESTKEGDHSACALSYLSLLSGSEGHSGPVSLSKHEMSRLTLQLLESSQILQQKVKRVAAALQPRREETMDSFDPSLTTQLLSEEKSDQEALHSSLVSAVEILAQVQKMAEVAALAVGLDPPGSETPASACDQPANLRSTLSWSRVGSQGHGSIQSPMSRGPSMSRDASMRQGVPFGGLSLVEEEEGGGEADEAKKEAMKGVLKRLCSMDHRK